VGLAISLPLNAGWLRLPDPAQGLLFVVSAVLFSGGVSVALLSEARAWFAERFPTQGRKQEVAAEAERLGLRSVERDVSSLDGLFPFLQRWGEAPTDSRRRLTARFLAIMAVALALSFALVLYSIPRLVPDQTTRSVVIGVLALLILIVAAFVVAAVMIADAWSWSRARLVTKEHRGWFAAQAVRSGANPRFDWVFTGRWRDLNVQMFDYSYSKGDDREAWTCALLPIDIDGPQVGVTRESVVTRLKESIGWRDVSFGDEEFDRAFRVHADRDDAARHLLGARVRSRLLADATPTRVVIQFRGRRMLYCGPRLPTGDRAELLEVAKRLRDSLPTSGFLQG